MPTISEFTAATFHPLVGAPLSICSGVGEITALTLVHVRIGAKRNSDRFGNAFVLPETVRSESFALTFRGPVQPALPQDTYEFDHPALGRFALLIVPIGIDAEGRYYEAVFG